MEGRTKKNRFLFFGPGMKTNIKREQWFTFFGDGNKN
jgi:hypothetical protein